MLAQMILDSAISRVWLCLKLQCIHMQDRDYASLAASGRTHCARLLYALAHPSNVEQRIAVQPGTVQYSQAVIHASPYISLTLGLQQGCSEARVGHDSALVLFRVPRCCSNSSFRDGNGKHRQRLIIINKTPVLVFF